MVATRVSRVFVRLRWAVTAAHLLVSVLYLSAGRRRAGQHTAPSAPSPACPSSPAPPRSWPVQMGLRHI